MDDFLELFFSIRLVSLLHAGHDGLGFVVVVLIVGVATFVDDVRQKLGAGAEEQDPGNVGPVWSEPDVGGRGFAVVGVDHHKLPAQLQDLGAGCELGLEGLAGRARGLVDDHLLMRKGQDFKLDKIN